MKYLKKLGKFLLVGFLLILSQGAFAQKPQGDALLLVDVTIVDKSGNPLPGATAYIHEQDKGVVADTDGKLSFWVKSGSTLDFMFMGMKTYTVKATEAIRGNIVLEDENSVLDQVVVTGYQRTTKRRMTGSLSTVTKNELKGSPTVSTDMLLQGKMAGVDVKAVSGRPGESARVRIRGTNTITGNADPLWVVDGVPLQRDIPKISSSQISTGDFNDIFTNGVSGINPNDIESITVLKDASATAIYGSRAAGGVIVITTRRGQEGNMRVNYSANVSIVTKPPHNADLMNSKEKLAWEQELWDEFSAEKFAAGERYPVVGIVGMIRSGYGKYSGWSTEQQDAEIERLGQHTTDWFGELFRNSVSQSHYLSVSGGSSKSDYYVSFGYDKNNGLVKKTDYDRYNVSAKVGMKPNKRVKLDFIADMSYQRSDSPSLNVDMFEYAYFANPYEQPFTEDGGYKADETYFSLVEANGSYDYPLPDNGFNIFREIDETSSKAISASVNLSANLSINIAKGLTFEGLGAFGYLHNSSDNINGKDTYAAWIDRPFEGTLLSTSKRSYGSITQESSYNRNYTLRGQLHYSNTFNEDHFISALIGSEIRGQYSKSIFEKRYGYDPVTGNSSLPVYPEGIDVDYGNMLSYASIVNGLSGQSIVEDRYASFYASADYVFKNRYVFSVTGRTDGSSNFGSDEQFNPTGSVGLAWNVDQESFFHALEPVMSSLTLRTSFGYTGNINTSVYPQLVMDYSTDFRQADGEYYRIGWLKNAPNSKLRWEKTRDMKASVEAGFLKERIHFLAEFYDRRTSDAVTVVPVVYTTGFSTQSFNTSTLQNRGMEFTLSGTPINGNDWKLNISANVAWNQNKLLKYDSPTGSIFNSNYVGYPLGSIISGKVLGIDKKLGIYSYKVRPDANMTSAADRNKSEYYAYYLGTSTAPINGGYHITLSYKNLSMMIGGSYSIGGKIINNIECPVDYMSLNNSGSVVEKIPTQENDLYTNHLNVTKDRTYRWTEDNPVTDGYPRIIDAYGEYLGLDNYMVTSSFITRASMLEEVSYFKLGSILLTYNFPEKLLKRVKLQSLAFSLGASNIFIITNYDGIDPETPGAVYPQSRNFSFGVSVGF